MGADVSGGLKISEGFFFFKQKTAYEFLSGLGDSEVFIRDRGVE